MITVRNGFQNCVTEMLKEDTKNWRKKETLPIVKITYVYVLATSLLENKWHIGFEVLRSVQSHINLHVWLRFKKQEAVG